MTWTVKHIRIRIKEAAKTLERLPDREYPREYGNAMPEVVRSPSDAYGYQPTRLRPTGRQISEMEQTFDWINALPTREDRIECFRYGWIATRKGATFAAYLEKNDIHRRNYERQIRKIFQKIADNVNSIPKTRNLAPGLQNVVNPRTREADKLGKPRQTHWMAPGARPSIKTE